MEKNVNSLHANFAVCSLSDRRVDVNSTFSPMKLQKLRRICFLQMPK